MTMVIVEFNAKFDKGGVRKSVRDYGPGNRNYERDRLIQSCQEYGIMVTKRLYRLPDRRLYT